ncbi:MAG: alpha-amylase family glycosyl hydrolase [Saprospiraceae bacterium]
MRLFYIFILIASVFNMMQSQNAVVGTGFSGGWGGGSCPTGNADFNYLSPSFGTSFGSVLAPNGTGDQYFRFGISWDATNDQRTLTIGSDVSISPETVYTLNSQCTTSGALKINITNTSDRYVFKTSQGGTNPEGKFIIFKVSADIKNVLTVSQSPQVNSVTSTSPVTVLATTDGVLPTGQKVFLRYTTNNWTSSSIVSMNGIGTLFSCQIPAQAVGTTVEYYVLTSSPTVSLTSSNADFFTFNGNTNNGSNYTYTVTASPKVTVNPIFPSPTDAVTIDFYATGTALAGASKVYFHSGVSTQISNPKNFNINKGNWGQDDGIGEMTSIATDHWRITLSPSLSEYFNVNGNNDIFGLNFLFRSADGNTKEDNSGSNYFNAVNTGTFFILEQPTHSSISAEINTTIPVMATGTSIADSWILKDITNGQNMMVTSVSNSLSFSYNLPVTTATTKNYSIEYHVGALVKIKYFTIIGYLAPQVVDRPTGKRLGINYHSDDPTKATLILHAPTYTRYLKGTGTQSGVNTTQAKSSVHVIGDFNNWTPSQSYLMHVDHDGWNGSIDADNDGDRGDYWWIELQGLVPGQEYVFQYLIDGHLQVGDPYCEKISDPDDSNISSAIYPNLINYPTEANDRASVLKTSQQPYSWKAPLFTSVDKQKLHIYELHFRDFTEDGTYLSAIEKLDYLKGLGVNAIHVMPVSEFEGNSSWGYNPNFYFAPDKAYGSSEALKQFIDACHKREILVFNDLVLNHAFYSNVMAKLYWNNVYQRPADDNPWFNPQHKMVKSEAGHWGADWNHESVHTQNMVDSILGFWISEYNFDGFRFDFTKGFGQTDPNSFPPGDDWASSFNQDRIDLLKRMVNRMWYFYPGSIAIFEHLAESSEDKALADHGVLMWSGVGHHNDVKSFILGYNTDNTNIYNSGVYNAPSRNFNEPHWMSYGESHDEERLGYELMQFYNGTKNTSNMIDRLKIAYGFNLFFPGPRMTWQFGELGYDISIDFNGRTGEKPVHWDYFEDVKRKELYTLISRIYKVRNSHNMYSTYPDFGNIGLGAGNIAIPRVMRLSSTDGYHAIVVANLDPALSHDVTLGFDVIGTWYIYNGAIDELAYVVNSSNQNGTYTLQPSEMMLFTNFKIDACTDVRNTNDSGDYSLRNAIDCANDGDVIKIEFPLFDSIIQLTTPIVIDKNIEIEGFENQNIVIHADFSGNLFEISPNKTVTLRGVQLQCADGNGNGRCIINGGNLTLENVSMIDPNSVHIGSSVMNNTGADLQILDTVDIKKY